MEKPEDIKARGIEQCRHTESLLKKWRDAIIAKSTPEINLYQNQLQLQHENTKSLIESLRMIGDTESNDIADNMDDLFKVFYETVESGQTDIQFEEIPNVAVKLEGSETNDIFQVDSDEGDSPQPRARTIGDDFCWSMIFTLIICLLFALLWTQYSKTH